MKWIEKIDDWIKMSRGKHLSLRMSDHKFWKDEYVNMTEFKTLADNCDLILFKSKRVATKLQRGITRSNYDHVGMLVLCETDDNVNTIYLLEAVSDEGVRLVEFLPNIEAYREVYSKIVYRPLQNWERTEEMLNNLDTFLEEVLGKSYGISYRKFLRKSMNLKNTQGEHIVDANRTFQWAELTAKMYKVLGILSSDEHSGKYVPASFTARREIELQKGSFGPECVIHFDDSE